MGMSIMGLGKGVKGQAIGIPQSYSLGKMTLSKVKLGKKQCPQP